MLDLIPKSISQKNKKNEIDYLRRQQDVVYDYDSIIAISPAMSEIMDTIKKLSQTDSTILVTGETGTGKSFCPVISISTVSDITSRLSK